MHAFGVDWNDGWAGNITAEMVGLVGGLLITYLIADKIIRLRLKRDRRPLRDKLIRDIESSAQFLVFAWSVRLYLVTPEEVKTGQRPGLTERLEAKLSGLDHDSLVAALRQYTGDHAIRRLAIETVTYVTRISRTADRAFQLIDDEPGLQSVVADVEGAAFEVEQALLGSYSGMDPATLYTVELGLVALTKITLLNVIALWRRVDVKSRVTQ